MNQRNILAGLLAVMTLTLGGAIYRDSKTDKKISKLFRKDQQSQNWQWKDDWNNSLSLSNPPTAPLVAPQEDNSLQIVSDNYQDALKKSGETGKPVFAFFGADWCKYCQEMKSKVMPDAKVKAILKNYVVVYINTDKDKASAKKFGVQSLPTFVVTNFKEDKLKLDSGIKSVDVFCSWLNDSSLFNQPKKENKPETKPESDPNRRIPKIDGPDLTPRQRQQSSPENG